MSDSSLSWTLYYEVIKKGQGVTCPFCAYQILLLKEFSERVHEDEDEDDDESVNCEGLDHRETDDEGCGNFT
jgi:DNA-directed RNA polymerase subunit RPC12/RpoP